MSKLDELIQKLCPNGVNFYSISQLVNSKKIKTLTPSFKVKKDKYLLNGIVPIISQEAEYISGYYDIYDKNIVAGEYVLFGDHTEIVKYVDFNFVQGADGLKIIKILDHSILTKYLYYAVLTFYKKHNNYERHFKYFLETTIPVPPLEVQREIVRILDNFTELTAELAAELTAELTARKKQYEYYRDFLLSFEKLEGRVRYIPLYELCDICTGSSNTSDADNDGNYPFFVRSPEPLKKNSYEFDDESIITAGDGVGVGKVFHYIKGKYALHQRAYRIHPISSEIKAKYLYYYFKTIFPNYIQKKMYEGSVPSIRRPMLNEFKVAVPSIHIQEKVIYVLDNFDKICSDLNVGLPAEIDARNKQYEHYRNLLLTFPENIGGGSYSLDDIKLLQYAYGVVKVKIKDLFTKLRGTSITATKMKEIQNDDGDIKIFAGGKTVVNAFEDDIPNANITNVPSVLVQSRGLIDFVYYDKPFTFKNEMWAYTHENQITVKYLYYYLKNNISHFREASSGMGAMPQISLTTTEDFVIFVPPINEQTRIVSILDRFEKLCNDIEQGLPAEIELRKQQYEYYRDKLLSFKELK